MIVLYTIDCPKCKVLEKKMNNLNLDFTKVYEPLYKRPLAEFRFQGYIYENQTFRPLYHQKIAKCNVAHHHNDGVYFHLLHRRWCFYCKFCRCIGI